MYVGHDSSLILAINPYLYMYLVTPKKAKPAIPASVDEGDEHNASVEDEGQKASSKLVETEVAEEKGTDDGDDEPLNEQASKSRRGKSPSKPKRTPAPIDVRQLLSNSEDVLIIHKKTKMQRKDGAEVSANDDNADKVIKDRVISILSAAILALKGTELENMNKAEIKQTAEESPGAVSRIIKNDKKRKMQVANDIQNLRKKLRSSHVTIRISDYDSASALPIYETITTASSSPNAESASNTTTNGRPTTPTNVAAAAGASDSRQDGDQVPPADNASAAESSSNAASDDEDDDNRKVGDE